MASSPALPVGAVGPALTVAAAVVLAVAWLIWSTDAVPAAVERPEYSSTVAPTSALAVVFTLTVGLVAPPAVIGALHTLSSVLSDALNDVSFVYVLPAESVTLDALALPALHTPASTTRRLPVVTLAAGTSVRFAVTARLLTCCTKAGDPVVAAGAGSAIAARTTAARTVAATAEARATRRGARLPFVPGSTPTVVEVTPINVSATLFLRCGPRPSARAIIARAPHGRPARPAPPARL